MLGGGPVFEGGGGGGGEGSEGFQPGGVGGTRGMQIWRVGRCWSETRQEFR